MREKEIEYLPMSKSACHQLGWTELDIIIVTGDAYIDHHSFGTAVIGRYLAAHGFRVGVIAQPDINSDADFSVLGKPRLFFGVTAGNIDSMVNHYTAQKKIRSEDSYSPDGKAGLRPDRATIAYTQKLQQLFKDTPVIIGGIEASLRRIAHYDFWQDKVRNSILFDSKASLLIYGMAEKTVLEAARRLDNGASLAELQHLAGTVVAVKEIEPGSVILPPADEVSDPDKFLKMTKLFYENFRDKVIYQKTAGRYLRHNPPPDPLTTSELDFIYNLPYSKKPHPRYQGTIIPAYEQIKCSITSHRGCFGGCSFCSLYQHQGKNIVSRSSGSIEKEIALLAEKDFFKGTISDIGGPSANMYGISCAVASCRRYSCVRPDICKHLDVSQGAYLKLLERCRNLPAVKHLFVSSGIRTDLALHNENFIQQLALYYTGGRIKVAPEHTGKDVIKAMNKQEFSTYEGFREIFSNSCSRQQKSYSVIPYFMVGHPGTTLKDAIGLAVYLKRNNLQFEQIQEFTPTPMTLSTAMYFTGRDPLTGAEIYVPKGREIRLQKALAQWFMPENKKYVIEALKKAGRTEQIAFFYDNKRK